jgi:hypothetical protein
MDREINSLNYFISAVFPSFPLPPSTSLSEIREEGSKGENTRYEIAPS